MTVIRRGAMGLSRESISDAALALIDAKGLDGFSMRKLASSLDIQVSSLYEYFSTKNDLFDEVANALAREIDVSQFEGDDWLHALEMWGLSYRSVLTAHPNAIPIVAEGTRARRDFLQMANSVQGGLERFGFPGRVATYISAAIKFLVVGSGSTAFASGWSNDERVYHDHYPHLSRAHLIAQRGPSLDQEAFEFALRCLLAGFEMRYGEVYLGRTGAPPSPLVEPQSSANEASSQACSDGGRA